MAPHGGLVLTPAARALGVVELEGEVAGQADGEAALEEGGERVAEVPGLRRGQGPGGGGD